MTVRVVTLGEALALVRTSTDTLAGADAATLSIGGAEANVAIGLARLGVHSAWLGRVGDDPFGERIVRTLRGQGVETHAIVDEAAPTAVMFKERRPFGRTGVHFLRRGSAGSRLAPTDLDALDIAAADLLHVTGILPGLSDVAAHASREAMAIASRHGVRTSFDVNHRPSSWSAKDAMPAYRAIAQRSDVVFGGVDELQMLVGAIADPRALAEAVASSGPSEVIVKMGDLGAGVLADGDWHVLPAQRVEVVDTVGAGDAFVAGYLATRARGGSPSASLRTGVLCGAAACSHPGDWEGAPSTRDVEEADSTDPVSR